MGLFDVKLITAAGTVAATGCYILYKDKIRFIKMRRAYSKGRLLAPMEENDFEVAYFHRPTLEKRLRRVLLPRISNEYYLVKGEVGSGKTRSLLELVRAMMLDRGKKNEGAPIYVTAGQGKEFSETLAEAVDFRFDEHLCFRFFLDFVLRIHSFPSQGDKQKLIRVLDAIEKSAFGYLQMTGRPVVLVIDGLHSLKETMPGGLESLQEKAKLWADANIVKVVFVSNDESTEMLLQDHPSNWSRVGTPINVGDLTKEEAIEFLTSPYYMEPSTLGDQPTRIVPMDIERAEKIYNFAGGRIHHLIIFKRDWVRGTAYDRTVLELTAKESEKLLNLSRVSGGWMAIKLVIKSGKNGVWLTKLIEDTSQPVVNALLKYNILGLERRGTGIVCVLESQLTESVVAQILAERAEQ